MHDDEKRRHYETAQRLIAEQNFGAAVFGGAVATVLAAAAYGITAVLWPSTYGFAAAGIGIVVGLSIGYLGRGVSTKFSVVAALYTIAGCVLGTFVRLVLEQARTIAMSPPELPGIGSVPELTARAVSLFSIVDLVYLLVAVFCAVFFARRSLSRAERLAVETARYMSRDTGLVSPPGERK